MTFNKPDHSNSFIFKNCEKCETNFKTIGIQVFYCQTCDKYYKKILSEKSVAKQKNLSKVIQYTYLLMIILISFAFFFQIDKKLTLGMIFLCMGFLLYKLNKLQFNPLDDAILISINIDEFESELKKYRKRELGLTYLYIIFIFLRVVGGMYFDSYLGLGLTLGLLGILMFYSVRRIFKINKLL